jgi:AcrR family transcriptional regulator
MPRVERREQILAAATRAFARAGFAATRLEDVAAEAGVSTVILYRHFESKADLYRAVLRRAEQRLVAATGSPQFTAESLAALVAAAGQEPDGFRLLFRQAEREPEFRPEMNRLRRGAVVVTRRSLGDVIPDPAWADWAASLLPAVAVEGVIAWLDAGQPDREEAARRIGAAVRGVIEAARSRRDQLPGTPAECP